MVTKYEIASSKDRSEQSSATWHKQYLCNNVMEIKSKLVSLLATSRKTLVMEWLQQSMNKMVELLESKMPLLTYNKNRNKLKEIS